MTQIILLLSFSPVTQRDVQYNNKIRCLHI